MPRVVPSQIVELIDQVFPAIKDEASTGGIAGYAGELTAIVTLAREIPKELLAVSPQQYADFETGVAAIEHTLKFWISRGNVGFLPNARGTNPLRLIRRTLEQCPDEVSSPLTSDLPFIGDPDLRENIRRDISAANHDLLNGEYKGATVLAGSAAEALLYWAITQRVSELLDAVGRAQTRGALRKKPNNDPDRWSLGEFIAVALELEIIKPNTAEATRLAQDFRNLIHPGRVARLKEVCGRGTAMSTIAAVELIVRDLTSAIATSSANGSYGT